MNNVLTLPVKKHPAITKNCVSFIFCRHCLREHCPDLTKKTSGFVAMLIPIVDENQRLYHAFVSVAVGEMKGIFAANASEKYVDLAQYATIHFIAEGLESHHHFMAKYFSEDNSRSL